MWEGKGEKRIHILYSGNNILIFMDFKVIVTFIDQDVGLYIEISRKAALIN